ncbi:acyltransferase [Aurantiacibacter zhengii]|uniref:Acyltransferase n=1 Tax=Aurantiacibacter zhengii TaxID=2307003 RepID=A0A418NU82_9SPHN|nr:acyltransferase [Aurantiacibacter zhengii]RIV87561.1 acyltransferase [Aurantiacibacter zhengii]
MAYLTQDQLDRMGFAALGRHVRISDRASIYDPGMMRLGDYCRVDDFCVLSGKLELGRNIHIAPFCLLAGGEPGITMADFSGLAYGVQVFSQSDDYSGRTMTNPTVPDEFKRETKRAVTLGRHVIVGAGAIVLPGVTLADGTAIGARALVSKSTQEWSIYAGSPARRVKARHKDLLELEKEYLAQSSSAPSNP